MTAVLRLFHSGVWRLERWVLRGSPFTAFLATGQILWFLKNTWMMLLTKNVYRLSKLSSILALTIYSFFPLAISYCKSYISMTKEAAISEKRDVSFGAGERSRAAGCLSSLAAASGKYLWSVDISQLFKLPVSIPHSHLLIGDLSPQSHLKSFQFNHYWICRGYHREIKRY